MNATRSLECRVRIRMHINTILCKSIFASVTCTWSYADLFGFPWLLVKRIKFEQLLKRKKSVWSFAEVCSKSTSGLMCECCKNFTLHPSKIARNQVLFVNAKWTRCGAVRGRATFQNQIQKNKAIKDQTIAYWIEKLFNGAIKKNIWIE